MAHADGPARRFSCDRAVDLFGYGASSNWAGDAAFCLAHEAAAVLALIQRTLRPVHLVGHSYGGAVALHIARTRGDLVRSLCVIEPVAFHLLRGGSVADTAALAEIESVTRSVVEALGTGDYEGGCRALFDYWSGPGTWDSMPADRRGAMRPQLAKVALDFQSTLHEPAGAADFGLVAVPTLVLRGSCTKQPAWLICERLIAALPEARVETIEGAGHMLPLTHRDPVNDRVLEHIAREGEPQAASATSSSFAATV